MKILKIKKFFTLSQNAANNQYLFAAKIKKFRKIGVTPKELLDNATFILKPKEVREMKKGVKKK